VYILQNSIRGFQRLLNNEIGPRLWQYEKLEWKIKQLRNIFAGSNTESTVGDGLKQTVRVE
jgi:hypothetical protein